MTVTIAGFTCVLADLVRETTQTEGTGTYSLLGAQTGKRTFVAGVGSGNRCPYMALSGASWERGIGTVTIGSPDTISRDSILGSSNGGAAVSWGTGTKDIYLNAPSELLGQIWPQPSLPEFRTPTATTSGDQHDFTSISSEAKRISVLLDRISLNGTGGFNLRLGKASAFATTNYFGTVTRITGGGSPAQSNHSTGFILSGTVVANDEYSGRVVLSKLGPASDTWLLSGMLAAEDATSASQFAGRINLGAALTRLRLYSQDNFDGGSAGLVVE
jgi:hypothetical protein